MLVLGETQTPAPPNHTHTHTLDQAWVFQLESLLSPSLSPLAFWVALVASPRNPEPAGKPVREAENPALGLREVRPREAEAKRQDRKFERLRTP